MNNSTNTQADTLSLFLAMLKAADVITVDDGPYLHGWDTSEVSGTHDNEIVRFSWTDGDHDFSAILTEGGAQSGKFTDEGSFECEDAEGEPTVVRFFSVKPISPAGMSA